MAKAKAANPESAGDSLPEVAFRRSKLPFDPRLDVWEWWDGAHHLHIDYISLPENVAHLAQQLKHCLMTFASGYSSQYVENLFRAFVHFTRANQRLGQSGGVITESEVARYKASLAEHQAWRLGAVSPLLQKWFELGLEGVCQSCVTYLRRHRTPGNKKGEAVRTRDPIGGPFSESEFMSLFRAANEAVERGQLPRWVDVLMRLLACSGGRISQYASLKVLDFKDSRSAAEPARLSLPIAKRSGLSVREAFLEFDLSDRTATKMREYIAERCAEGSNEASPLFPQTLLGAPGERGRKQRSADELFAGHCTGERLSQRFSLLLQRVAPGTDRLDSAPIPISPRRFRYTFGTRLAEEGASLALIADRLGHTDLQNANVYFEASPLIVNNIDKAMHAGLTPIARAFRGTLVDDEASSTGKGRPGTRIIDFKSSSTKPVGSCGKGGGCEFDKPVACYTCFRFEPWVDAPHEAVLQRLKQERDEQAGGRLAAVNDEAILAVEQVIEECRHATAIGPGGSPA